MDEKLKCPHKRIDHNGECLDCDEPVWADQTMTPIDKAIAALEAAGKAIYGMDNEAHQARHKISEALTELKAARQSGVPDGWVLVPREPTEEIEGLDEAIELAEFRRLNRNMETQRVSLPTRCLDTLLKAARQGRGG